MAAQKSGSANYGQTVTLKTYSRAKRIAPLSKKCCGFESITIQMSKFDRLVEIYVFNLIR